MLNTQIGVVNFEPLKPHLMELAGGVWTATSGLATLPSLLNPVHRNWAYVVSMIHM